MAGKKKVKKKAKSSVRKKKKLTVMVVKNGATRNSPKHKKPVTKRKRPSGSVGPPGYGGEKQPREMLMKKDKQKQPEKTRLIGGFVIDLKMGK